MSLYDGNGRLPEPGWVMGDDIARGINQPPEDRYMPDQERQILAQLGEEVSEFADYIESRLKMLSMWSNDMDNAKPELLEKMRHFAGLIDEFHDFTVGDDWDAFEFEGEREDYEDR